MRVLVIGHLGYIGTALTPMLIETSRSRSNTEPLFAPVQPQHA